MSLIWPRPHLPSEIANYKPRQRRVLSIKPGITWYAQIHGRDSISFDEEASKELEYIQNRSLWLDLYIIFATFGVLFWGRGK
jgi:lipopolysaccharide/colanic/teichoic acid biosynthesis glycosyltransferase